MQRTGDILKKGREEKNLSINEVAVATKINPRTLEAIENADTDNLPARTFLRGFVQSYASYLKLDVDQVLATFREDLNGPTEEGQPAVNIQVEKKLSQRGPKFSGERFNFKIIFSAVGIVLLIGLIIGIKNIVEKYERETIAAENPPEVSRIERNDSATEQVDPASILSEVDADIAAIAAAQSQKVEEPKKEVVVAAPPVEEKKPEEPKKEPEPQPEPKPEPPKQEVKKEEEPKKEVVAATPPPVVEETKPEEPKPDPKPSSPQEVIIEALDDVKIDFRVDGGDLATIELEAEQVHTIKAKERLAMDINDGGAVNIIHNGRDRGVPGELGSSIKVKYP